jgi:hypothetical protein
MKQVSKQATVETAYGNPLPEPVKFSYTYEELTKGDPIPAKEQPDVDDLITYVNQKRNAAARSAAQNEALKNAGIEKPTLEDPDVRLKTMVKVLVAAGNDEATATQIARNALGM